MKSPNPIPPGMHTVTPQLVARDARQLLAFLERAFGAEAQHLMPSPEGGIMHGYVKIGDSVLFLSDASGFSKPTTTNHFLYVHDVDAVFARATAAGARALAPVADMFWGDRWALVEDPFGNHWQIATHIEDVSPEEMKRRMQGARKS